MRVVVVTGTGTGVGKTVSTAALTAALRRDRRSVAVVKPVQTGVGAGEADVDAVRRLTGHDDLYELARLPDPLAPDTAARRTGASLPTVAQAAEFCAELAAARDLVIVEGAGGVLVRLDLDGGTVLGLADALAELGVDVSFAVVTSLLLGTLNHTELTARAIAAAGHHVSGLVVGAVPAELGLAERCNVEDLPRVTGHPIVASIPHGAGRLGRDDFCAAAPTWFSGTGWAAARSAGS